MERGDVRAAQAISMRCEAIAAEAQFETLYGNNLKTRIIRLFQRIECY